MGNAKWNFASRVEEHDLSTIPSMSELNIRDMNTRDCRRKLYERALNAALENLLSWERVARNDGFVVDTVMGIHDGDTHPIFSKDGLHVTFVKAYGVIVKDQRDGNKLTPDDLAETFTGKKDIREVD